MFWKNMVMEFQKNWKGFLIFLIVVITISGLMVQLYPVVEEEFQKKELEGEEYVELHIEDGQINITWDWEWHEITEHYRVVHDTASHLATSEIIGENITEKRFRLIHSEDDPEERYFAVIAVMDLEKLEDMMDEEEIPADFITVFKRGEVPVGMTSTVEPTDPLEEIMETPYFRMFTAGREDLRMDEIEGFMSIELYSWFILLVGLYIGYLAVKSVGGDYDERRMDIIFSTPLPRRQYILEKFTTLGSFLFALLLFSGLIVGASVYSIGKLNGVQVSTFVISMLSSWPMFLVIISVAMLFTVLLKSSRKAVGATLGFILLQYVLHMAGHMIEEIDFLRMFTIATYWDYNSVLLDGEFIVADFVLLLTTAVVLLIATISIFDRSDIPA